MLFQEKEILLKNGKTAIFRSPSPDMAEEMLHYLKITAGETPYLLRTPEECNLSVEEEQRFLQAMLDSQDSVMILCTVDGELAGNCQLSRKTKIKNRHRGSIGIALLEKFWGLGIGTAMFEEMLAIARSWGLMQVELEVIEGNSRAIALYRKMGFETVAAYPNAIRLEDGTMLNEYLMVNVL